MFWEMVQQAGLVALLSLVGTAIPLVMAVAYAIWPTEAKLALMRPLALAGVSAAICGTLAGLLNMLRYAAVHDVALTSREGLLGLSESLVPAFFGAGALTIAWLCVALGLRRQV